nr:MAG TPA: hypothetical protein [Caudoviricetes sp.]
MEPKRWRCELHLKNRIESEDVAERMLKGLGR